MKNRHQDSAPKGLTQQDLFYREVSKLLKNTFLCSLVRSEILMVFKSSSCACTFSIPHHKTPYKSCLPLLCCNFYQYNVIVQYFTCSDNNIMLQ